MRKPIPFLIDVDEVCLKWKERFIKFMRPYAAPVPSHDFNMASHFPGYTDEIIAQFIHRFHHSATYRYLPEIEGAREGLAAIRKLFPHSVITAVSSCFMLYISTL